MVEFIVNICFSKFSFPIMILNPISNLQILDFQGQWGSSQKKILVDCYLNFNGKYKDFTWVIRYLQIPWFN